MIQKMSKYAFILLGKERADFIDALAALGVVDIRRSAKPCDEPTTALFAEISETKTLAAQIRAGRDGQLTALEARLQEAKAALEASAPWGDYDRDKWNALGLPMQYHRVKEKQFRQEWASEVPLQLVRREGGDCWFVVIGAEDTLPGRLPAPALTLPEAQAALTEAENAVSAYRTALEARKAELPELDARIAAKEKELARTLAALAGKNEAEDQLVVYEGFAPTAQDAELAVAFDALPCLWLREEAAESDNPPIALKNNRFARLFEPLTGMYGMPVYGEFDPTPVLAPFFLLFFALCMGDAGYGLLLILFGIAVNKRWVNIEMFKNIGTLISVLGCATLVAGLVLGTAFGVNLYRLDAIPEGVKQWMISDDVKIAGYSSQMVLALAIGVLHICLAMVIKAVLYTKRFGFKQTISTWGWVILVLGGLVTAALALFAEVDETVMRMLIIGIGVISALAIFIFNKPGRNPLLNIGAGLWDSYQMSTGLLGDVLSYIRLYALGLAGGMLGGAFNDLALMVLGNAPTWHWLPFVLILIFGHVLNLLMSCLGAFVHPLRLTFVEYFKNAGYEGKGLKYNPIK